MCKGKVQEINASGAAFIICKETNETLYCNKKIVSEKHLKKGDDVECEFEEKKGFKNLVVTKLYKLDKPKPPFDMALKIQELSPAEYDQFCDNMRNYVRKYEFKNVTTSKIRNIFSELQKAKTKKEAKMLRPKLAYLAGRDSKTKFFMNDLDATIKRISTDSELKSFKQFFEAIVCYKKEIE